MIELIIFYEGVRVCVCFNLIIQLCSNNYRRNCHYTQRVSANPTMQLGPKGLDLITGTKCGTPGTQM